MHALLDCVPSWRVVPIDTEGDFCRDVQRLTGAGQRVHACLHRHLEQLSTAVYMPADVGVPVSLLEATLK